MLFTLQILRMKLFPPGADFATMIAADMASWNSVTCQENCEQLEKSLGASFFTKVTARLLLGRIGTILKGERKEYVMKARRTLVRLRHVLLLFFFDDLVLT